MANLANFAFGFNTAMLLVSLVEGLVGPALINGVFCIYWLFRLLIEPKPPHPEAALRDE